MHTKNIAAALAALALAVPAAAQSAGDVAAYSALVLSPVGGVQFVPLMGGKVDTRPSLGIHYGGTDNSGANYNRTAVTYAQGAGSGQVGMTAGMLWCDGCKNLVMLGVDWLAPLTESEFRVGIRPAIGASFSTESNSTTWYAGALSLPMSWVDPGMTGTRFVPFLEPGVGYGGVSASGVSDHGARAMLGGGITMSPDDGGYSIVLSAKQVFIKDAKVTYGLGCRFAVAK